MLRRRLCEICIHISDSVVWRQQRAIDALNRIGVP
jgi:hypothetical protein